MTDVSPGADDVRERRVAGDRGASRARRGREAARAGRVVPRSLPPRACRAGSRTSCDRLGTVLADVADVHAVSELVAAGAFGPSVSDALLRRLGDVVCLPHPGEAVYWLEPGRFEQTLPRHARRPVAGRARDPARRIGRGVAPWRGCTTTSSRSATRSSRAARRAVPAVGRAAASQGRADGHRQRDLPSRRLALRAARTAARADDAGRQGARLAAAARSAASGRDPGSRRAGSPERRLPVVLGRSTAGSTARRCRSRRWTRSRLRATLPRSSARCSGSIRTARRAAAGSRSLNATRGFATGWRASTAIRR